MTALILALFLSLSAQANVLSKCQTVGPNSSVTASFVPEDGAVVYLVKLSGAATMATSSRGSILWDGTIIEAWTVDKVVEYPDNEPAFSLTGDGVKALQIKLENLSATVTYMLCGTLFYKLGT